MTSLAVPLTQPRPLIRRTSSRHRSIARRRILLGDHQSPSSQSCDKSAPFSPRCPLDHILSADLMEQEESQDNLFASHRLDQPVLITASSSRRASPAVKRLGPDIFSRGPKRFRSRGKENLGNHDVLSPNSPSSSSDEEDPLEAEITRTIQLLPPEEQTRQYWHLCYGANEQQAVLPATGSSAARAPPIKGCLSTRATPAKPPRGGDGAYGYSTPQSSPSPPRGCSHSRTVKFGRTQAMAYDINDPSVRMTPAEVTEEASQAPPVDEKFLAETKKNTALLATWEVSFDDFLADDFLVDDDDDEDDDGDDDNKDNDGGGFAFSRRRRSPSRRESIFFGTSNNRSLLAKDDSDASDASPSSQDKESPVVSETDSSLSSSTEGSSSTVLYVSPSDSSVTAGMAQMSMISPTMSAHSSSDTTPPSKDVHLHAVQSAGGALDDPTTEITTRQPSPDNARQLEGALDMCVDAAEEPVLLDKEEDVRAVMEKDPNNDAEWDSATAFRSLAQKEALFDTSSASNAWLDAALVSLGARLEDSIGKSIDDFMSRSSNTSDDQTAPETRVSHWKRKSVEHDWMMHQVQFLEELQHQMQCLNGRVVSEVERLGALTSKQRIHHNNWRKQLEVEEKIVHELEQQIKEEEGRLSNMITHHSNTKDQLDITAAPFSAMISQATMELLPFQLSLDCETQAEFIFDHVVEGAQTKVFWDFESNQGSVRAAGPITDSKPRSLVPRGHCAAKFHACLVHGVEAKNMKMIRLENHHESVEQLLSEISVWLGRLDLASLDLLHLCQKYSVKFDQNDDDVIVVICLALDTTLRVCFDLGSPGWFPTFCATIQNSGSENSIPNESAHFPSFKRLCEIAQEDLERASANQRE